MLRVKRILSICILFFAFNFFSKGQNVETIRLNQSDIQSKEYAEFPADLCLFKYDPIKLKKAGFNTDLPVIKGIKDTAVAFLLTETLKANFPVSYTPIFVLNYKSENPVILYLPSKEKSFEQVKLNEQLVFNLEEGGIIRYTLAYNNTPLNARSKIVFPKSNFDTISPEYWLYQIPLFIRNGEFKVKNDKIMLGLVDANQNGLYNDYNTDMIFIAKDKLKIISTSQSSSCAPIRQGLTLNINNQSYILTALDKTGNAIRLTKSTKIDSGDVSFLIRLPDLNYENSSGISRPLSANLERQKFLFVYFWNAQCINCPQYVDELKKIYSGNSTKLNILALNWENSRKEIEDYMRNNGLSWEHGFVSPEVSIKLNQNTVPYGILFNDDGVILKTVVNTNDLKEFLQRN